MKKNQAFYMWFFASLLYLFEMVLRVSPSTMTYDLMAHFHIGSTKLGLLTSSYYYSYVLLQIPCGLIIDRFGPRMVITLSALLSAFGIFLFSTGHSFWLAQFSRFLLGAGSACVFIGCLKIASIWFSKDQFPKLCGFTNFMGTLGGVLAGYPLAHAVYKYGFQQTSFYLALICLVLFVLVLLFVRDKESEHHADEKEFFSGLKHIIKARDMWLIGLCNGMMYLPVTGFVELWAVPFLRTTYNIPTEIASSMSVLIFMGSAIGSTIWPKVSDLKQSYLKVMRFTCFSTASLFLMVVFGFYIPLAAMVLILIMVGVTMAGKILSFAWVNEYCGPKDSGVGIGFCNALTSMSGLIFQPLLGFILDNFWTGQIDADGVRIYTECAYIYATITIPVSLFACFVVLHFIKETYHRA